MFFLPSGRSAAWIACLTGGQEVVGSNPAAPTKKGFCKTPSEMAFFASYRCYYLLRQMQLNQEDLIDVNGKFTVNVVPTLG